jgi:hypothetical protein
MLTFPKIKQLLPFFIKVLKVRNFLRNYKFSFLRMSKRSFFISSKLYLCHPRRGGAEGYPKWRQCPPPADKAPALGSESVRACTVETGRGSARPLRLPPLHRDRCCRRSPRPPAHSRLRVYAQSFFWRRNPIKTLGFMLPWIFPWFFVGFLLSPPPYAHSFLRKPSFLILVDFFPWFLKSKQLLGFLGVVYMLQYGPNGKNTFYLCLFKDVHSKKDI